MNNEIALKLVEALEVVACSIEDVDWADKVWHLLGEVRDLIELEEEA